MNAREQMEELFSQYSENELIFASKLYAEVFADTISESVYYQTLSRMCKRGYLHRLSKGVYCRPEKTRFGLVLPSESKITETFTEKEQGVILAYCYPDWNTGGWPRQESFFNQRYFWVNGEFTPRETMRGKMALLGYLYGIRP